MSEEDFWRLTFREFNALVQRENERQKADNYRAAFIVSSIYNVNRDSKKHPEPFTPEDFLSKKKRKQSPSQMLGIARQLESTFRNKPKR